MILTLDDAIFSTILIMGIISMTISFLIFMYIVVEFFLYGWDNIRQHIQRKRNTDNR